MKKILCSSGAVLGRYNNNNYRLLKEFAENLSCDGFEFMIDRNMVSEIEEIAETVKSYGLYIPVIHANKNLGEYLCGMTASFDDGAYKEYIMTPAEEQELFEKGTELLKLNLKAASILGARKIVLHMWNGIASDKRLDNNIKRFGTWKDLAVKEGMDLLVENVICNQNDPLTNMNSVADAYSDVGFVYDTKMAEFHAQTLKLFDEPYVKLVKEGRIRHLHINDYGGGFKDWSNMKILPMGAGHVDFDTFFKKIFEFGYDGDFTVETNVIAEDGTVNFDTLHGCFDKIRDYMKKYGN